MTGEGPGSSKVEGVVGGTEAVSSFPSSVHSNFFTALNEFIDHMTTVPSSAPVTNRLP